MQYLGGKSRLAKEIAEIVNTERGDRPFWDPFCGGLSVSVALAKGGPGVVSDVNPALIALYSAVRDGWNPPETLTEEEYRAARRLPDTDPIKAFAGFGCSFGGRWFQGYARGAGNYARAASRSLRRDLAALPGCRIVCHSFLDETPRPLDLVIYCDPPYAGTKPYEGAPRFDHALFWSRVQGWERAGVPCFVSEYACPIPHRVVWSKTHKSSVRREGPHLDRTEILVRVTP